MIASLPWMQWLTVPMPRRPAGPATVSIPVTGTATASRRHRRRQVVPDERRRGVEDLRDRPSRGVLRLDDDRGPGQLGRPRRLRGRATQATTSPTPSKSSRCSMRPAAAGSSRPIAATQASVYSA